MVVEGKLGACLAPIRFKVLSDSCSTSVANSALDICIAHLQIDTFYRRDALKSNGASVIAAVVSEALEMVSQSVPPLTSI